MLLIYLIPDAIGEPHGYFSPEEENIHIHADLKVFITDEGGQEKELNLYIPENTEKNNFFHFHEGKEQENVIHFEGRRGTLANFFATMSMQEIDDCIQRQFQKEQNLYSFYVNGQPSKEDYGNYIVNDLDKLLFKCGSKPTQEQINSVGNLACIQSKKC